MKRLIMGTVASALTIGGLALVGPSAAATKPPPVTFTGETTCNVAGSMTFSPPLTLSGGSAATVTFSATLSHCSNAAQGGVTMTGGRVSAVTGSLASNSCTALLNGPVPTLASGSVDWLPTSRIAPSTGVTLGAASGSVTSSNHVEGTFSGGSVGGGSFAGSTTSASITTTNTVTQLGAHCSAGLSTVKFTGTATL